MATQGASSSDSHHNSDVQIWTPQELDYFSSSPLASPHRSPFSIGEEELSLGVFFSADEGEANDVLAALRVSLKVVKQTVEVVNGLRPRTEQTKGFADMLRSHEREFATWIFDGVGILPTSSIAIRSLPLFAKLVAYIRLLKDLQMDLPYRSHASSTPPATRSSFLRRLSSPSPSQSRPRADSQPIPSRLGSMDAAKDPLLAIVINKVTKSFAALKESITLFSEEQRKLRASRDVMERTRREIGIPHDLCLEGTRRNVKSIINAWADRQSRSPTTDPASAPVELPVSPVTQEVHTTAANEEPTSSAVPAPTPVLVLIGPSGSGKSALATTLVCEWKRSAFLGASLFLTPPRPTPSKRSSTGKKSSGDESDMEGPNHHGNVGHGLSLSRALSRIAYRRGSTRPKSVASDIATFGGAVAGLVSSEEKRKKLVVVVDGLDHADAANAKRVVGILKGALEKDVGIGVLLTMQRDDSPILEELKTAHAPEFVYLTDVIPKRSGAEEGGDETRRIPHDPEDIRRYVASRLPVDLSPKDQERIVEAVEGNFADAVRICRDVEETGAPERALDGVLYREAVRKYGQDHVKVVLV